MAWPLAQPNCAKRLECVELAPAFEPRLPYDSASKLDALQTLRGAKAQGLTQLAAFTARVSQLQGPDETPGLPFGDDGGGLFG